MSDKENHTNTPQSGGESSVERELRWLINNTDEPFLLLNPELRIVSFNRQFERMYLLHFGIAIKRGGPVMELILPERREMLKELYRRVLNGEVHQSVLQIDQPDGSYKVFESQYVPARDENRRIIGIFITARDSTAQHLLEAREQKMSALLRQAESISHVGSFEYNLLNGQLQYSEEFARITAFGRNLDSFSAIGLLHRIHEDDRKPVLEAWRQAIKKAETLSVNFRLLRGQTEIRHLKCQGQFYGNKEGKIIRISGIIFDSTDEWMSRLQLENTLLALNDRVKEQQCLYRITRLSQEESSLTRLFEKAVSIIPSGLQFPEKAEVCIVYDNKRFKTPEFRHVNRKITAARMLSNGRELLLEAGYLPGYLKEISEFLPEEKRLLESIVDTLVLQTEQLLTSQLQTSEQQRYISMFRSAPALVCIVKAGDFQIEFANPFLEKMVGSSDLKGKKLTDLFLFDPGFDLEGRLRSIIETGKVWVEREMPILVKANATEEADWRFINLACQPYRDSFSQVTGVIVYGIDLTLQVQARQALAISEGNYRTMFEENPHPIWIVDSESLAFLEANHEACIKYEFSAEEFLQMTLADLDCSKGKDIAIQMRTRSSTEQSEFTQGVFSHKTRSGRLLTVELSWHEIEYAGRTAVLVQANDITERKNAELALAKLQTNQAALINNTEDLIWSVDPQLRLITANRAFIETLEKSTSRRLQPGESLILRGVYPDEFLEAWVAIYERGLGGESFETEIYTAAAEAYQESWAQVRINPIRSGDTIVGIACHSRDITVSRHFEKRLLSTNQKLEMAQQIARLGYWEMDLQNNRLFWTDEVYEIWGVDRNSYQPGFEAFVESIHPDDRQAFTLLNQKMMEGREELDFEHRILLPNGRVRHVREKGEIVRNELSVPVRIEGTVQDITEQVLQLNEIIAVKQNLDAVINSTTDMIWSVGPDLELVTANSALIFAMKKLTGRSVAYGDRLADTNLPADQIEIWKKRYERALAGESFQLEDELLFPGNREKHFYIISFSPVFQPGRVSKGVVCYAKDITALKRSNDRMEQLNQQLMRKTEELATSNVELERFAYVASHDLQEPLRMVSSFLQLLDRKYGHLLDETGKEYVRFAVNGADRMKRLIQDLLDYSRLESIRDDVGETDMSQVVQEVIYTLDDRIRMSNAVIEAGPMPILPNTHRTQMFQLIQNLVNNGIKYNEQIRPVVRIDALEQPDHWLFRISDNGIGIDPRYFDKIFVVFQRLHSHNQYNGTGIGLSVCKKIVERAGGNIWVESAAGQGSTFNFTIPKPNFDDL